MPENSLKKIFVATPWLAALTAAGFIVWKTAVASTKLDTVLVKTDSLSVKLDRVADSLHSHDHRLLRLELKNDGAPQ